MEFKDYYEIMGVARDADQDEIKRAYRRLARKYHPDVSSEPDAESRFKALGEAYEVLKDPEKRAAYDQLGRQWREGDSFRPPPDWQSDFEFGGGVSGDDARQYSEFFEHLFGRGFGGGAHRQARAFRGEDRHGTIEIDLVDAYAGAKRTLMLGTPGGGGSHRLEVRIPRGICAGQHIRLAGKGEPGAGGGPPGDLYLKVSFRPHAQFRVEGADVYLDLPVTPWEAALGAEIEVATPSGAVTLKVPAGSVTGRKLRLKGRGIPARQPGDLYAVLRVVLPPAGNADQREFYASMAKRFAGFDPRRGLAGGIR